MDGSRFDEITRGLGRGVSRRTIAKSIAGGFAGLVLGGASREAAAARTLTICHATGDAESPYESLTISQAEFNLHARHGDYLRVECCADSDCASLDGACSAGACQNGSCVQLPSPAGTVCGGGICFEQGACDGAMNCIHADVPLICEPIDDCHLASCDPASGCVQTINAGAACTSDAMHEGVCDDAGVCQPVLVCTAALTCSSDSDCASGDTCIHGGCFTICSGSGVCPDDCSDCACTYGAESADRYCLDSGSYLGRCQFDADCPVGALCSAFFTGDDYLCTQPCAQKR